MADVPLLVPDASTALRWILPEREHRAQATDLVADFAGGRVNLLAPYHFPVEVAAAIRRQVAVHRMSHEDGRRRFGQFLAARIPAVNEDGLIETAFDNCQRFSISLTDALDVTLAEFYQAPLITADENLLRALQRSPFAVFLGDYEARPLR